MSWNVVATQYVIDRLQQVNLATDRPYIDALVKIEAYVLQGGPKSFSEALAFRALCDRYPKDAQQIVSEIKRQSAKERARAKWGSNP